MPMINCSWMRTGVVRGRTSTWPGFLKNSLSTQFYTSPSKLEVSQMMRTEFQAVLSGAAFAFRLKGRGKGR